MANEWSWKKCTDDTLPESHPTLLKSELRHLFPNAVCHNVESGEDKLREHHKQETSHAGGT